MPIISELSVTSASYNGVTLSIVGVAFSENQYGGIVEISANGVDWAEVDSYVSWGDSAIVCGITVPLEYGAYYVRVTNGDGEGPEELAGGFTYGSSGLCAGARYILKVAA